MLLSEAQKSLLDFLLRESGELFFNAF